MNILNKSSQWVDLHTHSNKSDGTLSPSQLLKLAISIGLATISLTDHDTVTGIKEIINDQSTSLGSIKVIKGIELSAEFSRGTLHILGYNIDINYSPLLNSLENLRKIREKRNKEIIAKLNRLGIKINEEDFEEFSANNQSPGRPHIARVLIKKKVVSSIDQAFVEYLGKNKKAYIPKKLYSAEEAISLIHKSGGFAFVAHPATLKLENEDFRDYLKKLAGFGLDGIEVYAPLHSAKQVAFYKQIAKINNLMISGGSDYHGSIKPTINLGCCSNGQKIYANQLSKRLLEA